MKPKFSKLFNNNAMARIIDALIEKQNDKVITIPELVGETDLSRRSVGDGLSILKDADVVELEVRHLTKYYKVNKRSKLTKYLINVYGMINIEENERTTNGRSKTVSKKQKSTREPRKPTATGGEETAAVN